MSVYRSLFVFTQDLRLTDNLAMKGLLCQSNEIAFVYIFDPSSFKAKRYQQSSLGQHRLAFINQSLADIREQLAEYGHILHVCCGDPVEVITDLVLSNDIDAIGYSNSVGWDEQTLWQQCEQRLTGIQFINDWSDSLFSEEQIQAMSGEFVSFSQFRRRVEKLSLPVIAPCQTWLMSSELDADCLSELLPTPCQIVSEFFIDSSQLLTLKPLLEGGKLSNSDIIKGGEQQALQHLNDYFYSNSPSTYKHTRNALDGFANSTKFSVYLANGNVSVRQVWAATKRYELQHGANESTYWIGFELLWREYFHWLALRLGKSLFSFKGQASQVPLTRFMPEHFQKWCHGNTPYPLVNACMKQLNTTGYMSNRGRQIVASCLVNELGMDWRYGAAYFEQQLIDYDVASNWGNWQYIAGVGVDPRGGRHFNIAKQTQQYDPNGDFIARWPLTDALLPDEFRHKRQQDKRQVNKSDAQYD